MEKVYIHGPMVLLYIFINDNSKKKKELYKYIITDLKKIGPIMVPILYLRSQNQWILCWIVCICIGLEGNGNKMEKMTVGNG